MRKLLPFELEDNPLRDDPFQFVLKISGLFLTDKYSYWIKCLLTFLFIYNEFFFALGLFQYLSGHMESIEMYFPMMICFQPIYFGLAYLIITFEVISQLQRTIAGKSSELYNAADERFLEKLESSKTIVYIGCIFIEIVAITVTVLFLPFIGDEKEFIYTIKFINECGQFSILLLGLNCVVQIVSYIGLSHVVFISIYVIFHIKFQCEMINNYFDVNIIQFSSAENDFKEDATCQDELYRRLMVCTKKHAIIERLNAYFKNKIIILIIYLYVTGSCSMVVSAYSLVAEISVSSNFRFYFTLGTALFLTVTYFTLGQMLTDVSNNYYQLLCTCPWYNWNIKNRRVLLIMLPNAYHDPIEMNFLNMKALNFPFMLQFFKTTYSFLAVAVKLK